MDRRGFPAPFSLDGETALITGGGSGIGLAVARCFATAGARVAITGRRDRVLEEAAAALGPRAAAVPGDVDRLDALPGLLAAVEKRVGPLSILVNNAGIHLKKTALETTDDDLAAMLQTHVRASFALAREAARGMLERKKGSVLFVGSMASVMGVPQVAAYTAAKTAVVGLTRALASEWSGRGVRVNAIVPGWIDTAMSAAALDRDPARKAKILSRTPAQRLGEPEDVGWAAVYLCSAAAKFVTGGALVVDGGASIGF